MLTIKPQPKGGSMLTVKPRHTQVLVKLRQRPETSEGGIVTHVNDASRVDPTRGVIVAVGPEVNTRHDDDKEVPEHSGNILTPGMHVILGFGSNGSFKLDGVDYTLIEECRIIAVVEE